MLLMIGRFGELAMWYLKRNWNINLL